VRSAFEELAVQVLHVPGSKELIISDAPAFTFAYKSDGTMATRMAVGDSHGVALPITSKCGNRANDGCRGPQITTKDLFKFGHQEHTADTARPGLTNEGSALTAPPDSNAIGSRHPTAHGFKHGAAGHGQCRTIKDRLGVKWSGIRLPRGINRFEPDGTEPLASSLWLPDHQHGLPGQRQVPIR
jgi:hypothetical protein